MQSIPHARPCQLAVAIETIIDWKECTYINPAIRATLLSELLLVNESPFDQSLLRIDLWPYLSTNPTMIPSWH